MVQSGAGCLDSLVDIISRCCLDIADGLFIPGGILAGL